MSTNLNANAFPIPGRQDDSDFNGLTMRDHFASHAPISIAEAEMAWRSDPANATVNATSAILISHLVALRFAYADAMLAERVK